MEHEPQPGQETAYLPHPQLRPAGEGVPVGQFDVLLFAASFLPFVEAPTAERPVEGVLEKPQPVQQNVAVEGQTVQPPPGFFED